MQPAPAAKLHLPSLFQFALSGLGLTGALTAAAAFLLGGVMALATPAAAASLFTLAAVALLVGLLLVPGGALALLRLLGKPAPSSKTLEVWAPRMGWARLADRALLAWPLVVLAGLGVARSPGLAWLWAPPLILLGIGIPIWWVIERARRGLPNGTPQRAWGLFGFGLLVTPAVVMAVEVAIMAALVALFIVWLSGQPELARELRAVFSELRAGAGPDQALEALAPYLRRPQVLLAGLGLGAVALPVVEELLKPLPLWLFAGRLRPAEGFTGGLLCGAAFALVESLGFSANAAGVGVPQVVLARLATGLLHCMTTALVGWGMATAWSGRPTWLAGVGRGLLAALLAITLHGLWNLFGLLLGVAGLPGGLGNLPPLGARLGQAAPLALAVLAAAMLMLLFGGNRLLRAEIQLQ